MKCKWNDSGWCYALDLDHIKRHVKDGRCLGYNNCKRYQYDGRTDESAQLEQISDDGAMFDVHVESNCEATVDKHTARKQRPVYSGVLKYFPDALMEVAHCSWLGNEQHNPGSELHWDRSKSADELDALVRHLMDIDEMDDDGVLHASKVAWRALAYLQKLLENQGQA